MGKGGQTIGYHYYMSLLFGLGRGPINELVEIQVGDKSAWSGSATDDSMQAITQPNLFGGEQKEGGIQGPFRLFPGRFDQVLPGSGSADCGPQKPYGGSRTLPNVKTTLGGLISEFRNVSTVWFDGLVSSMNPYPKEWKFRQRRHSAGWYNDEPWYPTLARIVMGGGAIHAMNPAHIIYQCLTDPAWGRGMPASYIDDNSFTLAANTLCDEGFGLCLLWQRDGSNIDEFINSVQEHIASDLYLDPETGLMTLKLLRNDYVVDDLPLFTPGSGLLEITDDDSASQDSNFNEIIGTGRDPITNLDFNLRCYNNASRTALGAPNPQKVPYPGIPTRDLMARVLQRDLRQYAAGLKKFNIALDRRAWRIRRGMPFCIADTRRGLARTVVRAVEITDSGSKSGRIEMKVMQDIFGMPATSFITPSISTWAPPSETALPATESRMVEANYRDLSVTGLQESALSTLGDVGIVGMLAVSPDPTMYAYDLATKATGEADYEDRASGSFTGAATLVDAIGPYDVLLHLTGAVDVGEDVVGQAVLCDDELMGVTTWDADTGLLGVERGIGDTVPATHDAAATLWTQDDDVVTDGREYAPGETVHGKVLTRAVSHLLDPADAPDVSITVTGRWEKPYPPGNVRVGTDLPLVFDDLPVHAPPFTVNWSHRDRILQADQNVGHLEGSVGPEDGVTYTIRTYTAGAPTVVSRTVTGITGTSWEYDATMFAADGSPVAVWIELEAVRGGLVSYQHYRFKVPCVAVESGSGPLVSVDFKNGTGSILGVTKALAELVHQTWDAGPFDPATDIVPGAGLRIDDSTGHTYGIPVLTADAFAAATSDSAGFTVLMTVSLSAVTGVYARAKAFFTDAGWGYAYEGNATGFADDYYSATYDYGSAEVDQDYASIPIHKIAFTFTPTTVAVSADGNAAGSDGPTTYFTPGMIFFGAYIGGSGYGASAVIEKVEIFPAVADADLPALTT